MKLVHLIDNAVDVPRKPVNIWKCESELWSKQDKLRVPNIESGKKAVCWIGPICNTMRIARPWAMPADINKDCSHSQGIFISPMLCYFRTVILLLSCLTFWTPHVSHSSYAFISTFATPSSIFKTTVDCFNKGSLNVFPKVNVYSFSSHFAVVFTEYGYDRIIKYVKAIVLYYGMKG